MTLARTPMASGSVASIARSSKASPLKLPRARPGLQRQRQALVVDETGAEDHAVVDQVEAGRAALEDLDGIVAGHGDRQVGEAIAVEVAGRERRAEPVVGLDVVVHAGDVLVNQLRRRARTPPSTARSAAVP